MSIGAQAAQMQEGRLDLLGQQFVACAFFQIAAQSASGIDGLQAHGQLADTGVIFFSQVGLHVAAHDHTGFIGDGQRFGCNERINHHQIKGRFFVVIHKGRESISAADFSHGTH